ncbi:MAG: ATP-binding protein [Candidatus Cloacimonadales bacterium]|nr:ATP-binding protein [Candidatus Cloacimonadales bacterium]
MKNNYKLPKSLGNKYFLIYSFMTLFLFSIIIILQFSINRFLIYKNESSIMLNLIEEKQDALLKFVESQKGINNTISLQIKENQEICPDSLANNHCILLTEEQIQKKDIEWDFLNNISQYIYAQQKSGLNHFIAIDESVIYSITYQFIEQNYKNNLLLCILPLSKKQLGAYDNLIFIERKEYNEKKYPLWMNKYIKANNKKQLSNILYSYQKEKQGKFYYFTMFNNLHNDRSALAINELTSDIDNFFTRTWIIMTALLLVSLLVLIFTFGKWFSIQMLKPIKDLANHMRYVAENPTELSEYNYDEKNELQLILKIYNEMVQSLQQYQYSLLQYKTLFDKAHLAFFWLNEELQIKLFNPEFLKLFELDESPENKIITDITPLRNDLFKSEKEYIFTDLEMWLEALKKYITINLQKQEINNQTVYIGIIGDITTHRQLQESKKSLEMELIRINRLAELGKRIQGIVHNLNSPLNSILGFAQFAKEDIPDNTDIDKIISSAKTMSQTIKLLLLKIKKDSMASPDLVDLNDFITLELANYKHHLFFKNEVSLKTNLADNLPKFLCTYGDLSQVFNIIFNNAIDAMERAPRKEIAIKSFQENNDIGFEICDSGIGIKKEYLERIFEVNFSTKTMSESGGFGLGLAIAKTIINKMNGKIEIESEIGNGTCFRVFIPIEK